MKMPTDSKVTRATNEPLGWLKRHSISWVGQTVWGASQTTHPHKYFPLRKLCGVPGIDDKCLTVEIATGN